MYQVMEYRHYFPTIPNALYKKKKKKNFISLKNLVFEDWMWNVFFESLSLSVL